MPKTSKHSKPAARKNPPKAKAAVGEIQVPQKQREDPSDIVMYLHCKRCIDELPLDESPRDWARLNVGWTPKGLQIWCARHDINVAALDFLGQKIDYDKKWHKS